MDKRPTATLHTPPALGGVRTVAVLLAVLTALVTGCSSPESLSAVDAEAIRIRHVPLEGASNFRDFGGYQTEDGRRVALGNLYRSDQLSGLTDSDQAQLEKLGIRLVVDFRGEDERRDEPTRIWPGEDLEVVGLEITDPNFTVSDLKQRIMDGQLEGLDFAELMVHANRNFAGPFSDRYGDLLDRLQRSEQLPVLIYCSAGKDRTGFGAAMILRTLGVPRETIFQDYLLTNPLTETDREGKLWAIWVFSLFRSEREVVRPLLEARREYLEAAFALIDSAHGGFDRYRRQVLGVSDVERDVLRSLLLEPLR